MTRPLLAVAVLLTAGTMTASGAASAEPDLLQPHTAHLAADFRANFPTLTVRSDGWLRDAVTATCTDIAAGMLWPELRARVEARYGVNDGSGVLSLAASYCTVVIRQP